jgi:hypothetical protein
MSRKNNLKRNNRGQFVPLSFNPAFSGIEEYPKLDADIEKDLPEEKPEKPEEDLEPDVDVEEIDKAVGSESFPVWLKIVLVVVALFIVKEMFGK